jgi:hypothetical protein
MSTSTAALDPAGLAPSDIAEVARALIWGMEDDRAWLTITRFVAEIDDPNIARTCPDLGAIVLVDGSVLGTTVDPDGCWQLVEITGIHRGPYVAVVDAFERAWQQHEVEQQLGHPIGR